MKEVEVSGGCDESERVDAVASESWLDGMVHTGSSLAQFIQRGKPIVWKWHHQDGYQDYDRSQCARLEKFYQGGHALMQWKGGKHGQRPMIVFFNSMLQYDSQSENTRPIQRFGPDTVVTRLRRSWSRLILAYESGKPQTETFEDYAIRRDRLKERRKAAVYHNTSHRVITDLTSPSIRGKANIFTVLANHHSFTYCSLLLVLTNALWILVATDLNEAPTLRESEPGFQAMEHIFCSLFCMELLIRFVGHEKRALWYLDAWFVFDLILVTFMVLETWVFLFADTSGTSGLGALTVLRLLRLVRITRVSRLVRWMPQMTTLLRGVLAGLKKAALAFVLLFTILYLFAIVFRSFQDMDAALQKTGKFNTVHNAAFTLLVHGIFLDEVAGFLDELATISNFYFVVFVVFVIIENCTVLNILIGFQCEVAHTVSQNEEDNAAYSHLKSNLLEILQCYDRDGDGHIGRSDFDLLLQDPEVCDTLSAFGTDVGDLASLGDLLFENISGGRIKKSRAKVWQTSEVMETDEFAGARLTFTEFLAIVARLRGNHSSKVTDIVELREYIRQCMGQLVTNHKALADCVEQAQARDWHPDPPIGIPPPTQELRRAASLTCSSPTTLTPGAVNRGVADVAVHSNTALSDQAPAFEAQLEPFPASGDSLNVAEGVPSVTPLEIVSIAPFPVAAQLPFLDRRDNNELQHPLDTQQIAEPVWLAPPGIPPPPEELQRAASISCSSATTLTPGAVNRGVALEIVSIAPSPVAAPLPSLDRLEEHELKHALVTQQIAEPLWLAPLMGEVAALGQGHEKLQRAQLEIQEGQQQLIRGQQRLAEQMQQLSIRLGQAELPDERARSTMSFST